MATVNHKAFEGQGTASGDDAITFYRANEWPFGVFSNLYPRWPPQTAPPMATQTAPGRTG